MFIELRSLREDANVRSCPQKHPICTLHVEREPEFHIIVKQQTDVKVVSYISVVKLKSL